MLLPAAVKEERVGHRCTRGCAVLLVMSTRAGAACTCARRNMTRIAPAQIEVELISAQSFDGQRCLIASHRAVLEAPAAGDRDLLAEKERAAASSSAALPEGMRRFLRRLATLPDITGIAVDRTESVASEDADTLQVRQPCLSFAIFR